MQKVAKLVWVLALAFIFSLAFAKTSNSECVQCHQKVTPGIVHQFHEGKMGNNAYMPLDCSNCHGAAHHTMDDADKVTFPTPDTCMACHADKVQQFRAGKHDLAWYGMKTQSAWHAQPAEIVKDGYTGCSGCHTIGRKGYIGAEAGNTGPLKYDGGVEMSHYKYGNAQCDTCHTRHTFSKKEAQDPRACSNCHMGFDHPQWEMYMSSKHGIIWAHDGYKGWDQGGRAPTCQTCHMQDGNHNVVTSWGFLGLRLPTKENVLKLADAVKDAGLKANLQKLAAALPSGHYIDLDDDVQWTLDRARILQANEILDENFQPTQRFFQIVVQARAARGPEEFNKLRIKMKNTCQQCHSKSFVDKFFISGDKVVRDADHEFAKAIVAVQGLYKDGILKKPKGWKWAPSVAQYYDNMTPIELDLYLIYMEYRQRAFQGAFHASRDYSHWYGWGPLKEHVNRILYEAKRMREEHNAAK